MHRLGADAHAVGEAPEGAAFADAFLDVVQIRANLLRPVAGHAAADGENTQRLVRAYAVGVVIHVQKRVEAERRLAGDAPLAVVKREIQPQLGIAEGRHVHRHWCLQALCKMPRPAPCSSK